MRRLVTVWLGILVLGSLTGCGGSAPAATPAPTQAASEATVGVTVSPVTPDSATATSEPADTAAPADTATPADTAVLDATVAPDTADAPSLTYYWPTDLPRGLVVLPFASYADARGFMVTLQNPQDRQYFMQVTGGQASGLAEAVSSGAMRATVRGVAGYEFSTGGGWSFHWEQGDVGYSVGGIMGREDTLAVAEGLEAVSLATFRERLAALPQAVGDAAGAAPAPTDRATITTGTATLTVTGTVPDSQVAAATITALGSEPPLPLAVAVVTASSTLASEDLTALGLGVVSYDAGLTLDGRADTAWVEGVAGAGAGETITFRFGSPVIVVRMAVSAGLERDEQIWQANNRPRSLTVTYSDGMSETVGLADRRGLQEIGLGYRLTDSITLTLRDVYAGTRYDDTPLTEVRFVGYAVE